MAGIVQRVQGFERVNFFGVRHLSPAASWHLLNLLDSLKPKCVLIEGPSDATHLIREITGRQVELPIALMAYTSDLPVSSVLYPFAAYSPEYQAMRWAADNKAETAFIDLPTGVTMSLNRFEHKKDEQDTSGSETDDSAEAFYALTKTVYESVAGYSGEHKYDSYWERNFEHNLNEGAYREAMLLQSDEIRKLTEPAEREGMPRSNASDLVREAYMAACIARQMERYKPEDIVVVTGAYHSMQIKTATIPMTEEETVALPKRSAKLTLMPYSFYRLSTRSGYGAGNAAPGYFNMMWQCMNEGSLPDLPVRYMSTLGRFIRENGGYCSSASVIEAVRLSHALTYMKGGSLPTLADLHDACIACIGHGDLSEVASAFAMADIGTDFGSLPDGVSQTSTQDDVNRQLKRLKLEKYKTTVAQRLDLDLRENTKTSNLETAFIDLNRSTFLHRLAFLGISFATKQNQSQASASWRENWLLAWSPEVEIQIVESVLKGDTIELAAAFLLKERLEACESVLEAAQLISTAYICGLTGGVDNAVAVLQAVATASENFEHNALAAYELSSIIQYGSIRKSETEPLLPLLRELFLRACLILSDAASCDDGAAVSNAAAIGVMHTISQENYGLVDDEEWIKALKELAFRDDKNAKLSGLAFAVLLERGLVDDARCSTEISRRLSNGTPASIGAGWFEGMSMRNRYALLSRIELWRELDNYVTALDDDEFKRSVVFLRRAFGNFDPREKNSVAELLADFWGLGEAGIAAFVQDELNEEESAALEDLNAFDFDF